MKRQTLTVIVFTAFLAVPAVADMSDLSEVTATGNGPETLLYDVFNTLYGTHLTSNADLVSQWGQNNFQTFTVDPQGPTTLISYEAVWMDAWNTQDLDLVTSGGTTQLLFGGIDQIDNTWRLQNWPASGTDPGDLRGLGLTGQFVAQEDFGFQLTTFAPGFETLTTEYWYSQDNLNAPNETHMLFFNTPIDGVWFAAVEDRYLGHPEGHNDFNDFVFELRETVIPEPSSLVLLGMGIAGMAIRRFRRTS